MEIERNGIHAVPFVGGSLETLAFEDMAEMATTSGTSDLNSGHPKCAVSVPRNCSGDSIEESRPATSTRELGGRFIERSAASGASIYTVRLVLFVLSRTRRLSSFLPQHPELFSRKDRSPFRVWPVERTGLNVRHSLQIGI